MVLAAYKTLKKYLLNYKKFGNMWGNTCAILEWFFFLDLSKPTNILAMPNYEGCNIPMRCFILEIPGLEFVISEGRNASSTLRIRFP